MSRNKSQDSESKAKTKAGSAKPKAAKATAAKSTKTPSKKAPAKKTAAKKAAVKKTATKKTVAKKKASTTSGRKSPAKKKAAATRSTTTRATATRTESTGSTRKAVPHKKAARKTKRASGGGGGSGANSKIAKRKQRWTLLLKLGAVLGALGVGFVVYLDALIQDKFEGKRWAIPAKVYARPLELFEGAALSDRQVLFELQRLGYRKVPADQRLSPGTYSVTNNPSAWGAAQSKIAFHTRGFQFWDGQEPAQPIELSIVKDQVKDLVTGKKRNEIARLEPSLIGGIYPAHNEDRVLVTLDQVPPLLIEGLLAVEDRDFYEHWGLSFRGIARAMVANVKAGGFRQGGSTLTQQLVKNFYLSSERSLRRKIMEAIMSVLLDAHYEKDDILEAYLNEIYLGQSGKRAVHGFGLASLFYFGQPLRELQPHQIALMVGLVKGASWYDPRRNSDRALERRNQVLAQMEEQGVISAAEKNQYSALPLDIIAKPVYEDERYPAFLDLVKRQLRQDYRDEDLRSEGLQIFTTIDSYVQERVEDSFQQRFQLLEKQYGKAMASLQGAAVFTETHSGEVVAMLGDRRVRYKGFNRALDAYRPVGSLMKPLVFLAALEKGYTLATMVDDSAYSVTLKNGQTWAPLNFDKKDHGQVPLQLALANSYNQATARVAMDVGVNGIVKKVRQLGVEKEFAEVPAIALGAVELSPYEVAGMYQTLAASGFYTPLRSIRSVLDSSGKPLQRYGIDVDKRVSEDLIYLLTSALQETVRNGTGKSAYNTLSDGLNIAGKTGTSDEQRDSWFAGWVGNYLGIIWLGQDENLATPITGATGALPVWIDAMKQLPLRPLELEKTSAVEWVWINPMEQALSKSHCEGAIYVPMLAETVPRKQSKCGETGKVMNWIKRWFGG